jgi:hypothetical protein
VTQRRAAVKAAVRGTRPRRAAALGLLVVAIGFIVLSNVVAGALWTLAFAGYAVMGCLVVWHQPRNAVGWWLLLAGVAFALQGVLVTAGTALRHVPIWLEAGLLPLQALPFTVLIVVVVLFPDGRVESRLQRAALIACALVATVVTLTFLTSSEPMWSGRPNPLASDALGPAGDTLTSGATFITVPILLALGLASLVTRWRRSNGVIRQQYRWLALGVAVMLAGIVTLIVTNFSPVGMVIGLVAFNAVPATIGIAVTRYHLYDIDRIISRTASYAIVTGILLTVYALIVTSASRLLHTDSPIVVAAATLAAAALARPALRRVQGVVDRRFDRAHYDGLRTVDAFGAELRYEVDSEAVGVRLVTVVQSTLGPEEVALWLPPR